MTGKVLLGGKEQGMLGCNREASEGERMRGRRGCFCTQSQQAGGGGGEIGSRRKQGDNWWAGIQRGWVGPNNNNNNNNLSGLNSPVRSTR